MYLFRLTYYSHNKLTGSGDELTEGLRSILVACRKNNPANGISGALLFSNRFFGQILEGDRKAVTETFCRISNDPRHSDIVILQAKPIEHRRFDDWAMTVAGNSELSEKLYNRFSTYNEFNPAKMSAESLEALIEALAGSELQIVKEALA